MIPVRVSLPAGPLVDLPALKKHLRVDFNDDDDIIESLEKAAVAHLDGWRGLLGRCIQQQVWRLVCDRPGQHRLPFPDVVAVNVSAGAAELLHDALGSMVTLTEAATVEMTVQSPEDVAAVAVQAVKMIVGHWYTNRDTVVTGTIATVLPFAAEHLIDQLRARSL